jgi:hypothetical protein
MGEGEGEAEADIGTGTRTRTRTGTKLPTRPPLPSVDMPPALHRSLPGSFSAAAANKRDARPRRLQQVVRPPSPPVTCSRLGPLPMAADPSPRPCCVCSPRKSASMSELYPSIAQCAVVATALKLLLFPA